jgi:REP element-mobilizing transposase RayT
MQLNTAGEMVDRAWQELSSKFPGVDLASHVVMPNHVHGLVVFRHPTHANREATQGLPYEGDRPTLSTVVGWFKTMSTNWYMHGVRDAGWPPFDRVLWQRSFHDRIVRNDAEMDRIWTYISDNPALWEDDRFYS